MHTVACLILSVCCLAAGAPGQAARRPEPVDVLERLLALPAPPPRTAFRETRGGPRLIVPDVRACPADDAPTAELVEYWGSWAFFKDRPLEPSDAVKERLLAACEADPARLAHFLPLLPRTTDALDRIKTLYDDARASGQLDERALESIGAWLRVGSPYYLADLRARASEVSDGSGYVYNREELEGLARFDWASAEPMLLALESGREERSAALAVSLLYRHAIETEDAAGEATYRARLLSIAANRAASMCARDTAIRALSLAEWPGRDDWYLSLLADEAMRNSYEGNARFTPLTTLFERDPERWIPVMSKLVESGDRAVQQSAASCLVRHAVVHPRRDAIMPVIGWLSDPDWLEIAGHERDRFITAMADAGITESIPGLIWIVENDEEYLRWAAGALARFGDSRAVPALRRALDDAGGEVQLDVVASLFWCGGLPEPELLAGLEAYAAMFLTPEGRERIQELDDYGADSLPAPAAVGRFMARQESVSDSFAAAVFAHAERLRGEHPDLSLSLLQIAHNWRGRAVAVDLVRRIADGTAGVATIAQALDRRADLRAHAVAEVLSLVDAGSAARGIAAVLLEDDGLARDLLESKDLVARIALLAGARLTGMALGVDRVGALRGSDDPALARAAELYLAAEDSAEAQQLLWARHPNDAFVTGWREAVEKIDAEDVADLAEAEKRLRAELFEEGGPIEILALLDGEDGVHRVVRVYRDRAVFARYESPSRFRERAIDRDELAGLRDAIAAEGLPESGPRFFTCSACEVLEFVSLARRGGRRVLARNGYRDWAALGERFDALGRGSGARMRSNVEGGEVLFWGDGITVQDVWKSGPDLRVLVSHDGSPEEPIPSRASWRSLAAGALGEPREAPPIYSTFDALSFGADRRRFRGTSHADLVRAVAGDSVVLAAEPEVGGLWRKAPGREAVPIRRDGLYSWPVTTPDGHWAVVAKAQGSWHEPQVLVRVDLRTGREHRVSLPPADSFAASAFVPAHEKVLVWRVDSDESEYFLLDARTGRVEPVTGVFRPLAETGQRSLQPTGRPDEVWAAIPDDTRGETRVGRYNVRDFTFEELFVVPHLTFGSMNMWVDEEEARLYVAYEGQLLHLLIKTRYRER